MASALVTQPWRMTSAEHVIFLMFGNTRIGNGCCEIAAIIH